MSRKNKQITCIENRSLGKTCDYHPQGAHQQNVLRGVQPLGSRNVSLPNIYCTKFVSFLIILDLLIFLLIHMSDYVIRTKLSHHNRGHMTIEGIHCL